MLERFIIQKLMKWKDSKHRKPLILNGVRQVGKTWLLKEFGRRCFQNTAYFNFDEQPELSQFFETTKDANRILQNLMMVNGSPIIPGKTLIIFDEIQESNAALNTLKYFCENAPEYVIACAGSLLGIALSKPASFPVGKVNFLSMKPMTFSEFLTASGDENLVSYMKSLNAIEPIPELFASKLSEKLKMYFITGGMPEAVRSWTEDRDVNLVQQVLWNILSAYERDFAKHADAKDFPKISLVWKSIPSQLARENKKFLYSATKPGARAREYEDALQWLCDAELAHKVYRCSGPGIPLAAYDDMTAFKLYLCDVGLLRRLALLAPSAFGEGNRLFTEFKGALSENYVLQALVNQFEVLPRYWTQEQSGRNEVDFIIQRDNDIFPVEVKSDQNLGGVSLKVYGKKYPEKTKIKLRFSMRNLKLDDNTLNIPLYLADYTDRLISLGLK